MRLGIVHHLGWAVAVTATADHRVVDRRRIELVEPGVPAAPIHHEGGPWEEHRSGAPLDDDALAALVAEVRASTVRATATAFDALVADVGGSPASISFRAWPDDFPTDIAAQRVVPHESRADSVRYLQVLAEVAGARGWAVHRFDARTVEADATARLGGRAHDVLHRPRQELGPPWTKDHRQALAATVVAAAAAAG